MTAIPQKPKSIFAIAIKRELQATLANGLSDAISEALEEADLIKCCLTCRFFTEATEQCEKVKQRPPAKIICYGCEAYEPTPEVEEEFKVSPMPVSMHNQGHRPPAPHMGVYDLDDDIPF